MILAGFAAVSFPLGELAAPASALLRRNEPALRLDSGGVAVEQALVSAVVGGFRAAAADLVWLRAAGAVEERDGPTTEAMLEWVSVLDPRSLYFWLNGARIMAYDIPGWRTEAAGQTGVLRDEKAHVAQRRAAHHALRRLEEAMKFHPASAVLWIERANIELNQLGDLEAAAASYRRASEQPHAPYYAARVHGELLRRLGQKSAALAWLIQLHPQLPPGEEAAGADQVLARIRVLERELGVAPEQAYRPLTLIPPRSFLHPC